MQGPPDMDGMPGGPAGPSGTDAPPRLNLLSSTTGFLDRTMELQIGASSTHFTNGSVVSSG